MPRHHVLQPNRRATAADPSRRARPSATRALDLLLVLLALPVAIPIGLLVAVAVVIDSPGPVFYRSRRVGQGGRSFGMLKFRTMLADAGGPAISAKGDRRQTPLGRSLAATRLDELPQLWNVLRGEMRVVGPRPEVEEFVAEFAEQYREILSIPPGLTGPTQLEYAWEGRVLAEAREHDRERLYRESILPLKLAIDLDYVRRGPGPRDVLIVVRTLLLPLRHLSLLLSPLLLSDGGRRRAVGAAALLFGVLALTGLFVSNATTPL